MLKMQTKEIEIEDEVAEALGSLRSRVENGEIQEGFQENVESQRQTEGDGISLGRYHIIEETPVKDKETEETGEGVSAEFVRPADLSDPVVAELKSLLDAYPGVVAPIKGHTTSWSMKEELIMVKALLAHWDHEKKAYDVPNKVIEKEIEDALTQSHYFRTDAGIKGKVQKFGSSKGVLTVASRIPGYEPVPRVLKGEKVRSLVKMASTPKRSKWSLEEVNIIHRLIEEHQKESSSGDIAPKDLVESVFEGLKEANFDRSIKSIRSKIDKIKKGGGVAEKSGGKRTKWAGGEINLLRKMNEQEKFGAYLNGDQLSKIQDALQEIGYERDVQAIGRYWTKNRRSLQPFMKEKRMSSMRSPKRSKASESITSSNSIQSTIPKRLKLGSDEIEEVSSADEERYVDSISSDMNEGRKFEAMLIRELSIANEIFAYEKEANVPMNMEVKEKIAKSLISLCKRKPESYHGVNLILRVGGIIRRLKVNPDLTKEGRDLMVDLFGNN